MPAFLCRGQGDKNSERTDSLLLPCKFHQGHQEDQNSSQLLQTLLPTPQLAVKSPLLSPLRVELPCPAWWWRDFILSKLIIKPLALCIRCGFLSRCWGVGQLIPGLERRPSIGSLTPPCGCWDLNSGPLEEQSVLLTSEASLQPNIFFFRVNVSLCSPGYPGTM